MKIYSNDGMNVSLHKSCNDEALCVFNSSQQIRTSHILVKHSTHSKN